MSYMPTVLRSQNVKANSLFEVAVVEDTLPNDTLKHVFNSAEIEISSVKSNCCVQLNSLNGAVR